MTSDFASWLTIIVAGYAALVSTAALTLEVRRWFESGPRLSITIMPEAESIGIPETEGETLLFVTVTNRGNSPTTIKHFLICDYGNRLRRIIDTTWLNYIFRISTIDKVIRKCHLTYISPYAIWNGIVPNPEAPGRPPLPHYLQPGEVWAGMVKHDNEGKLRSRINGRHLYVVLYASHGDKPIAKRVVPNPRPPSDAEEM